MARSVICDGQLHGFQKTRPLHGRHGMHTQFADYAQEHLLHVWRCRRRHPTAHTEFPRTANVACLDTRRLCMRRGRSTPNCYSGRRRARGSSGMRPVVATPLRAGRGRGRCRCNWSCGSASSRSWNPRVLLDTLSLSTFVGPQRGHTIIFLIRCVQPCCDPRIETTLHEVQFLKFALMVCEHFSKRRTASTKQMKTLLGLEQKAKR